MNSSNFSRYALAVCGFASALAACSSGGPQVTPLGSMQQRAAPFDMRKIQSTAVASVAHGAHRVAPDGIVYTPANVTIKNSQYNLDLNNDGTPDFVIVENNGYQRSRYCPQNLNFGNLTINNQQSAGGIEGSNGLASALSSGSPIGPGQSFLSGDVFMEKLSTGYHIFYHRCFLIHYHTGNWLNVTAYLGLAFPIRGRTHYGWAALTVSSPQSGWLSATLTGYAYQTIAGKSISAGHM